MGEEKMNAKQKTSRRKNAEANKAARYSRIEHEPQDPKVIERWFRKPYGKIGEEFKH